MSTTRSGSWLALTLATFALLLPSAVSAQRGIGAVVMPFDGPGSDTVRGQVHDALAEDPRLVVAPLDEGASDAQVLVSGSTSGRATRRTFELVASDAQGTELATQSGRIARGAAGRRAVADATRALIDAAIARLPPPPSTTQTETETTTTETEPRDTTPTPAGPTTSNPGTDPAIVTILAGAVFRNRNSDVRLENGGTQIYDSGFYVELALGLEVRPLAHDPGLARGLFLRGSYAHAVGLGTQDCPPSGTCQRYDTTFFRAYGDVGFLFDLGRVVEIGAGLGFGYDAYQIADNRVMPGVEYPYLRPSIRGRIRILEEIVVLDAEVGFRSLFGRDRLSTAFGPSGDSFGLDAGLGVTGIFDFGLTYRADFSWASYWHSFAGGGTLATATSGTDHGIRIGVMLGYGFR
jgi:hypothetical protein